MIPRYKRKGMDEIWRDQNKYQKWLDVELAVLKAKVELDLIPEEVLMHIENNASFTVKRIEEIDKEIEHDMIAFIMTVQENLDPKFAGEFHKGLTSYDIEEPAMALLLQTSVQTIIRDIVILREAILKRAKEHKWTIMAGRTHAQTAEPITLGFKLLNWNYAFERNLTLLKQVREVISYAKISGAVGVYGDIDPRIEKIVCQNLKPAFWEFSPPKISTQILQRDRHAQMMSALAITAATIEKIATDIRLLSQTEIQELREPFKKKQKGSSAMPHKENPIICERLCGQARIIRANLMVAIENIATWHERDITQSSAERIIFADSFELLDYMLNKLTWVIEGMKVFPENMLANLEKIQGTWASQKVKTLLLNKGVEPEETYRLVQKSCFEAIKQKKHLKDIILGKRPDLFASKKDTAELESCFDYKRHLKHIDEIFRRFGL